jgi:pimeloyl-ACP methyl ester carboxylesterase
VLAGGCAKLRGIGVTQIKAKTQSELQGYLLAQKPDLERFALRGPFAVGVHLDHPVRLSATEQILTDRYLAATGEKGPLVVFLHGYDASKEDHAYQAFHVASWGMHALSVQLPNTGPWTGNGRTLARLVSAIQRAPEIVDRRIDPARIVLVGHSFGASSVAVALGEGAPAVGGILLDAAGIGKELTKFLRQINKPVLLLGADEYTTTTRNRELFYGFIPRGVAEVSIKDAGHEDAQFSADRPLQSLGSASMDAGEGQLAFVSALTSGAFSLLSTGTLDYAWSSFSEALGDGKFMNARRK